MPLTVWFSGWFTPFPLSPSFLLKLPSPSFCPSFLTCPCRLPPPPQVDSMDNFTPSNTPSREDDPRSHLKSRSRSPSMASDMEPIEVRPSANTRVSV